MGPRGKDALQLRRGNTIAHAKAGRITRKLNFRVKTSYATLPAPEFSSIGEWSRKSLAAKLDRLHPHHQRRERRTGGRLTLFLSPLMHSPGFGTPIAKRKVCQE